MLDQAPPEMRQASEAQILGAIMTQLQVMETDPPIVVTTEEKVEEVEDTFNPFAIVIPSEQSEHHSPWSPGRGETE